MNMKGSLPLLILNILTRGASHGYRIAQQIKAQSEGVLDFKEGTLYPTLHSLEQQGLLEAYTTEENGRPRRYYQITSRGRKELEKQRQEWNQYVQAVNLTLGDVQ